MPSAGESSFSPADYDACLEQLVVVNMCYLKAHSFTPPLARLAHRQVQYRRLADDDLSDIATVMQRGHGDVSDLVCWRVAELRQSGEDQNAKAMLMIRELSGCRVHTVYVVRGDGRTETWDGKLVEEP